MSFVSWLQAMPWWVLLIMVIWSLLGLYNLQRIRRLTRELKEREKMRRPYEIFLKLAEYLASEWGYESNVQSLEYVLREIKKESPEIMRRHGHNDIFSLIWEVHDAQHLRDLLDKSQDAQELARLRIREADLERQLAVAEASFQKIREALG